MARDVADIARLLDVMVGYDTDDPLTALGVGQTAQITPNGTAGATVGYATSDPRIATVSGAGLVTAAGLGQTTITTTLTGASGTAER